MRAGADRVQWGHVIEVAAGIVSSYSTSVTLRQLFYRLVSMQLVPNTSSAYKNLSKLTAEARRNGDFPSLIDQGRRIHRYRYWNSAKDALDDALAHYRLDRTAGQEVALYVGVEKAGMVVQLQSWFGELGIPIVALGGYSSQTYVDEIASHVYRDGRDAVLLYAGDFDPSGEDIDRDFADRSDCWQDVERVALSHDQVIEYNLPINAGKVTDCRAGRFIDRHGSLMQVELDALDPNTLQALFQTAIDGYWDTSQYQRVLRRERRDLERLEVAVEELDDQDEDDDDD